MTPGGRFPCLTAQEKALIRSYAKPISALGANGPVLKKSAQEIEQSVERCASFPAALSRVYIHSYLYQCVATCEPHASHQISRVPACYGVLVRCDMLR